MSTIEIFIVVVMKDGSRMTETTSFDFSNRHDWEDAMKRAGVRFEPHRGDIRSVVVFTGAEVSEYSANDIPEIFGWGR